MKTSLIIDLAGNLQSRSRQYAQALTGLSETGRRSFAALRSSAVSLGRGIDAVSNRYTAAIAGMGATWKATQAVMHSASLDKQLARITRTAGVSRTAGESLRRELYVLAEQTGQSVDELLQGFFSLVQAGQSYDEALATTRALAPAMAVTGASAETLSSAMTVAAQNFKFDLSDVKMAKLLLDQMTKAGDLGNAELEHLADIFARVGGNARNAGLSMTDTLALIEQMSLVEKQPERLATLVDSTLRLWNNENYRKQAEKVTGVKFFDEKGNRRNAFDILAEMSAKYGKFTTDEMRSKGLFAAFGKTDLDTQRGIAMMLQQGIPAAARDMAGEIQRSGGLIEKALPDAIANSVDQVARLKAALGDAADSFARPVNDAIEKGITSSSLMNRASAARNCSWVVPLRLWAAPVCSNWQVALWRAPVAALWPARPESLGAVLDASLCRCRSTWSIIACPLPTMPFRIWSTASPPVCKVMSKRPASPAIR